jgi:hypothetical protein
MDVRADAHRQRLNRHQRKARTLSQHSQANIQVLQKSFEHWPLLFTANFFRQRDVTEVEERQPPRFIQGHPGAQVVFVVYGQMVFQLFGEFAVALLGSRRLTTILSLTA